MRRPMVAGNWKMHGSRAANQALLEDLESSIETEWPIDVAVFPPYVYLSDAARHLEHGRIKVGAQDVCAETQGAFTGQVSAQMLKDVGCTYVIVGHSERRRLNHEDDGLVARKFAAAQRAGLTPVLCVGESLEERETGMTEAVVGRQIDAVINLHGMAGFVNAILAYEPVWAIGTGEVATPADAQEIIAAIRERVSAVHGGDAAENVRILYGGSVKANNIAALMAQRAIDGALVGGASLDAGEFVRICRYRELAVGA